MESELDHDRRACLEIIRAARGKPVSIGRLRDALGKNLLAGPAVNILTQCKGVTAKRHKGKVYFISKDES